MQLNPLFIAIGGAAPKLMAIGGAIEGEAILLERIMGADIADPTPNNICGAELHIMICGAPKDENPKP